MTYRRTAPRIFSVALLVLATACGNPASPDPAAPTSEPAAAASPVQPVPVPPPPAPAAPQMARYRLTFEARWSQTTHPVDFPGSAHFSPLIGVNHDSSLVIWREGLPASQGIREMAEMGRTIQIERDAMAATAAGTAEAFQVGPAISKVPATVTMDISISQTFPLYTVVTMIAPSPDWFVGVAGVALFEGGEWVTERRYELAPWDAGTDSGQTFSSADLVTSPQSVISRITAAPLSPNGQVTSLGTLVFTRIE